uniref:Uncharacterized protein n=1 Tax=Anopheles atroparvus TaxID=41427 RepID=A0A182IYJ2_ANOAO
MLQLNRESGPDCGLSTFANRVAEKIGKERNLKSKTSTAPADVLTHPAFPSRRKAKGVPGHYHQPTTFYIDRLYDRYADSHSFVVSPLRLHVVAAALLDAEVGVNRGVARRAGQVLVLAVADVDARAEVAILLRQPEVDQEQLVAVAPDAHEEVIRLDVAVDEVLHVQILQPADHLVDEHQHGLDREVPAAKVEEVLQRRSEQVHHQHVVAALLAEVANVRDADAAGQHLVQLVLVRELRVARQDALHLQRHLLAIRDVDAEVDIAERARSDLADDAILAGYDEVVHML